jgi:DNA-binding CsgD family transcriptional regulator
VTSPFLTDREIQILHMLADGHERSYIAGRLRTSLGTVKADLAALYAKLGAINAAHAVHIGHRVGLLGGPAEDVAVVQQARQMGYRIALAPLAGGAS